MISFIIPAYNEELLLGTTLASVQTAAESLGAPCEVIVVDDASTDRTAAIAEERGARVVKVEHRQISASRNSGARASSGEFLIFVDADTVVNADVVRAAVDAMRGGAVGGGCRFDFDGRLPTWARVMIAAFRPFYRMARLAGGCFLFCTREAFDAVGGFDGKLYAAEELALSRALGRQGRFVILQESVTTSGRKLRAYSPWEVARVLCGLALQGLAGPRKREGLEIWYGERRKDPDAIDCDESKQGAGAA